MAAAMSKRQQARNERTLQELIKTVPGNNSCADCGANNPGWASWSLGIFLCMRCAALHRKLGTHITKVKSLSMDSWSNDQVDNMKRMGNVASNRIYNPQNAKPPIPFDADEVDAAVERFIRQKYQDRSIRTQTRQNTGSTTSDDHPPPLPPKTGSRFGFRSASSIFPLSSKAKREAAATASLQQQQQRRPDSRDRSRSPPRRNKPSKLFGADVGEPSPSTNDVESNLIRLRDMGFRDDRQNLAVLKNVGGDLQKAIGTLVKLGDSQGPARSEREPAHSSGSRTPVTPSGGMSLNRSREKSLPRPSSNPFDMLDTPPAPAPPQSSQSTGTLAQPRSQMGSNPFQPAPNSNPFGLVPSQSQTDLNDAFQNLAVSPPSQPLFPNHTGGFPGQQQQQQQLHMQAMTPPVPSIPQQFYPPVIYENPAQQPQQTSYNPFLQQQQQQRVPPPLNTNVQSALFSQNQAPLSAPVNGNHGIQSNLFNAQQQTPQAASAGMSYQTNPYAQQQGYQSAIQAPASQSSAIFGQNAPQQAQQQYQQQQNPFLPNNTQQASQQSYFDQQHNPYQQLQGQGNTQGVQQLPKPDKRSILDLYNYPQLAPTGPQQALAQSNGPLSAPLSAPASDMTYQPPNPSGPMSAGFAGNRNPFMSAGGAQNVGVNNMTGNAGPFSTARTGPSRESMAINAGDWQNGRHSPDAWGTISARTMG